MTSATFTNPFLYLQANADSKPNGIFSRSATETVTNAQAVVSVKKIAYELRRLGVKPGDVVALDLPDQLSILFTEAVYHEAGISTVLPENYASDGAVQVDWLFTRRSLEAGTDTRVVTVDARFLQQVEENPYGISPSDEPIDTLRIVFSSGTTGTPNAIALGRAMEVTMDAALPTWFSGGPYLVLMDTGTAWGVGEFFLSVKAGEPYLCAGGADQAAIVRILQQNAVRCLKGSPAQIAAVVDELEARGLTVPSIETVFVAGTVMPPGVAERMRRAAEGCVIFSNYGSTEAGGTSVRLYESDDPFDAGHPLPGASVEIVDEDDQPLPDGTPGRIRLRGPGMASEYLGNPDATARAFVDGWFYPGDLGYLRPDKGLTLTGRESEVINAGGVKIDPNRLDHFALENPGVLDAASFGYTGVSGLTEIGIALVTVPDLDLQAVVAAFTAEFHGAAPKLVAKVDAIPRTATGKPVRRELSARFSES